MPTTVDLKHEYFGATWPGRVKIIEILLGILCMILCACPAVEGTQIWFMIVVVFSFLGTVFLSLYYLCVDQLLKGCNINWSQAEFWFTALATFLYLTAWAAQLATYSDVPVAYYEKSSSWYDSQVAAGVFGLFNNLVYAIGTYFVYLEWRANPAPQGNGAMPPA